MSRSKTASEELEILVSKIQKQLAPNAEIIHDAKLMGRKSKVMRQIDVLVTQKIGQYEMILALECKDYARPADVNIIGTFHEVLLDIGAHTGAMVCPKGFTLAAKNLAKEYQIELYSPVDTEPHKWQVKATVPVICDFRSAKISFGVSHSAPGPFLLKDDFYTSLIVSDKDNNPLGTIYETALKKWNEGKFPTESGIHEDLKIFDTESTFIDNGYGTRTRIKLYLSLFVEKQLYFGNMPVSEISGFKDEQTGLVITNAFTMGFVSPEEVESTWLPLKNEDEAPLKPLLKMIGLVGYD